AEDGIRDDLVTGVQSVLFRSREINIIFIRETNLRQFLFRGRINGIKILARLRRHESAVDEKLIAVAQFNVTVRFQRGRVTPTLEIGRASCRERVSIAVEEADR